ncbi:MAG: hypothetical protein AAF149_05745 [Bacteroidota bacterium]
MWNVLCVILIKRLDIIDNQLLYYSFVIFNDPLLSQFGMFFGIKDLSLCPDFKAGLLDNVSRSEPLYLVALMLPILMIGILLLRMDSDKQIQELGKDKIP